MEIVIESAYTRDILTEVIREPVTKLWLVPGRISVGRRNIRAQSVRVQFFEWIIGSFSDERWYLTCCCPHSLLITYEVPPLIVMSSPQEHPQLSRRERIKSFIRNPASIFSSNSRASRNSRAHHCSPPNTNVDVAASRPTSASPANVSSRTDLV